jgi:hypothetical protein
MGPQLAACELLKVAQHQGFVTTNLLYRVFLLNRSVLIIPAMEERLCYRCLQVDFHQLFQESSRTPWDNLRSRPGVEHCPFCQFLLSIVEAEDTNCPDVTDWSVELESVPFAEYHPRPPMTLKDFAVLPWKLFSSQTSSELVVQGSTELLDRTVPSSTEEKPTVQQGRKLRLHLYESDFSKPSLRRPVSKDALHSIYLFNASGEGSEVERVLKVGHFDPERVDFNRIRKWLTKCEHGHNSCILSEKLRDPLKSTTFRLIDVRRECLVDAFFSYRYLALSYVWGSGQYLALKIQNKGQLYSPGFLSIHNQEIAHTIRDTLFLCQQIGERYIWVDSLCILQDSPFDKHAQIANMDQIYHNALLTVVGAAGDASSGLVGVRDHLRQKPILTVSIDDITMVAAPDRINDLLARSPWTTRGWCLQEQLLSRRLLIFTASIVLFNCEQAIYREDIALESDQGQVELLDWTEKSAIRPHGSLTNLVPPVRVIATEQEVKEVCDALSDYAALVSQYVQRSLSKEEDILNAFIGILKTFIPTLGVFRFHMPLAYLGTAMMWQFSWDSKRPMPVRRSTIDIPSWSWAAWTTKGLQFHLPYSFNIDSFIIPITLCEFKDTDQIHPIPTFNHLIIGSSDTKLHDIIAKHCSVFTDADMHQIMGRKLISPLYRYLVFWTSVVSLDVTRSPINHRDQSDFDILSRKGEVVASVPLHDSWREAQPDRLEFALLAINNMSNRISSLLIEWADGIARRVDLVKFKQKDWLDSSPQRKLIVLG